MAEGGLLDFLSSPAGMGLLSAAAGGMAGARRGAPWNTAGAALLGGLSGYQQASENQPVQAWRAALMGGGQPKQAGQSAGMPGAAAPSAGGFDIRNIPPNLIAQGLMHPKTAAQAKALADFQKQSIEGYARDPEKNTFDPSTGKWVLGVKRGEGQQVNTDGSVTYAPEYTKSVVGHIGAIEREKEAAKAGYDLLTPTNAPYDRATGAPMVGTRADAIGRLNGGKQNAPQQSSVGIPNMGANTVAPYQDKRIRNIAAQLTKPHAYDQYFVEYGKKYGVDPRELKLRAIVESGLNPNAVSAAGARGLMQLMPATAQRRGVNPNDPRQAIEGAARLISKYQQDAGGHNSMVDMLYYGGENTNEWGANTQQYAANLNAVRQSLGLKSANIGQAQKPTQQTPQQAQGGLYYPTPAEQAGLVAQATAKVEEDKQLAIVRRKDTEESFAKLQDMESMMPRLEVVTKELSDLGKKATYTKAGQGRDAIYRQLGLDVGEGAIARREYISKVDNEILPLLRQTFGAQFTQKEGESLKATLGDTDASPEEKDAVLRSFIETKYGQIAGLKRRTGQQGVDSGAKTRQNSNLSAAELAELAALKKRFGRQ